jgi:hypothetical protein
MAMSIETTIMLALIERGAQTDALLEDLMHGEQRPPARGVEWDVRWHDDWPG